MSEEDSDYNATDSDDDYEENEKILLNKVRNRSQSDSEESETEVLSVGAKDSDSDQSDIALSDVEGQEDDDLPDIRAWGKKRKAFYSTDYVDQDYGGLAGQTQEAEMEEDEVNLWEKELQQQLDDTEFVNIIPTKESDKKGEEKGPKAEKAPEMSDFHVIADQYHEIMDNVKEYLKPVVDKYKKGQIPNCPAMEFVNMMYEISLNYITNIAMWLLLKASPIDLKKHPIIKRLNQYRQLLDQTLPTFEEIIKPQIKILLNEKAAEEEISTNTLRLLKKLMKRNTTDTAKNQPKAKKVKFDKVSDRDSDKPEEVPIEESKELNSVKTENKEQEKRPINYQIAKNKGLTPHRKKELRNPRVKHRIKFRKANIRRKGAVRQPRTEMQKYGGEISGIKATVSKSVKIKS